MSWSEASLRDLGLIDVYLSERDPAAAVRILRAIRSATARLVDYPRIGRAFDEPFRVLGARGTRYLLVYRIADGRVEIARVRHSSEDWLPRIEGEL